MARERLGVSWDVRTELHDQGSREDYRLRLYTDPLIACGHTFHYGAD